NQVKMSSSENSLRINILMSQITDLVNKFLSDTVGQIIFFSIIIILIAYGLKKAIKNWRKEL
ncbi:MAG: hypothetical protein AABX39_06670, partial [Nanoarchaeota archaeon]